MQVDRNLLLLDRFALILQKLRFRMLEKITFIFNTQLNYLKENKMFWNFRIKTNLQDTF